MSEKSDESLSPIYQNGIVMLRMGIKRGSIINVLPLPIGICVKVVVTSIMIIITVHNEECARKSKV